jgi:hypothetical protein
MKIAYILLLYILFPLWGIAQNDVTQFLGIPIDGTKSEMINKLKSIGYTLIDYNEGKLEGEFNGTEVDLYVVTYKNKVYRILIVDKNYVTDKLMIKRRFNNLMRQFQDNKSYIPLSDSEWTVSYITDNENIEYEILIRNKRYIATYYQNLKNRESYLKELTEILEKTMRNEISRERAAKLEEEIHKKLYFSFYDRRVWFTIMPIEGTYKVLIYYDNVHNMPKGEDL